MEKGKQVAAPADNTEKEKHVVAGAEHAEMGKQIADAEGGNGSSGWGRPAVYSGVAPLKRKFGDGGADQADEEEKPEEQATSGEEGEREKIYLPADVKSFRGSDSDDTDEESDGVRSDMEYRDPKSRDVLKKLKADNITYLLGPGKYKCLWCFQKEMPKDYLGMLQHATYYGAGSLKHQLHLKAKHAAYGVFLFNHLPQP